MTPEPTKAPDAASTSEPTKAPDAASTSEPTKTPGAGVTRRPPLKPVDPKGAAGAAKVPLSVVPPAVLLEMGAAMGEGAIKYGPHNWRASGGVVASTYVNACLRHLLAFMMGEDVDPDTVAPDGTGGVSHLVKMMASAAVLRDAQLHGVAADDRPAPSPPALIDAMNATYRGLTLRATAARPSIEKETP